MSLRDEFSRAVLSAALLAPEMWSVVEDVPWFAHPSRARKAAWILITASYERGAGPPDLVVVAELAMATSGIRHPSIVLEWVEPGPPSLNLAEVAAHRLIELAEAQRAVAA